MLSEIVKFKPKMDGNDLNKMERDLNGRFSKVAKKFGGGLKKAIIGGGVLALGTAVIGKLLNPLKEAQEVMDRILNKGDDAVTFGEEFGTDPGKLLRLQALAEAKGVDAETFRTLITKFQSDLAEERLNAKDPTKQKGLLRDFIDEQDTTEAFFQFIQSLQKADKDLQTFAQNQIFGEKIRGKAAEFFNAKDYQEILARLPTSEQFSRAAKRSGALSDEKDLLGSIRNSQDFIEKAGIVNGKMVQDFDQSERLRLQKESKDLRALDTFKPATIAIQELTNKFDNAMLTLAKQWAPPLVDGINKLAGWSDKILEKIATFTEYLGRIANSPFVRKVFGIK